MYAKTIRVNKIRLFLQEESVHERTATVEVGHTGHLHLNVSEQPRGHVRTKHIYLMLDPEQTKALRDFLNEEVR